MGAVFEGVDARLAGDAELAVGRRVGDGREIELRPECSHAGGRGILRRGRESWLEFPKTVGTDGIDADGPQGG